MSGMKEIKTAADGPLSVVKFVSYQGQTLKFIYRASVVNAMDDSVSASILSKTGWNVVVEQGDFERPTQEYQSEHMGSDERRAKLVKERAGLLFALMEEHIKVICPHGVGVSMTIL